jgi:hypothetical protein
VGLYINDTPAGPLPVKGKAKFLLEHVPGTELIEPRPMFWRENLVCVVDNGPFEAAAYCDTPEEFRVFNDPRDPRPKWWLVVFNAAELAR